MKRVLFVSVHPDDETLGCGGTILKCKAESAEIFWLNITGGSLEHPYGFSQEMLDQRDEIVKKVIEAYGFSDTRNLNYPTQMLESVEPRLLIGSIKKVYDEISPDTIFVPNRSDIHSDHRVAFEALFSAAKNFRSFYIKEILMYETLSETEFAPPLPEKAFIPNTFIDISDYMEEKLRIMQYYHTEVMPDPLPRSSHAIKALAGYRGSRIGVKYAEAFQMIYRNI
ncbi:MAG: PIG-L family deacetylase [Candidatus Cloacimonetes bacterium]|nr:PIG-L family deacetylase [Candidatus Cloacimonadota bacterium]